ncbi:polysaccharide biosynthesis/export family protein [Akkermansiaceae bacterium]|nr:polysaccharide biosynthesis/export family protein [Akkermansiaceae bacterium]MDB4538035.1 polysaccharide biosynthesis/export family protein [Akkermansiaceae bacterium]
MKLHHLIFSVIFGALCPLTLAAEKATDDVDPKQEGIKYKPDSNYRLKGGDEIQLIVYEEEELNKTIVLTPTGEATFSLIETINFTGMTLSEASTAIENAYKPDYLKKPKVTLDLITAAAERVSVSGAVVTIGQVAIPQGGNLDILGAISLAGGLSKEADRSKIVVTRGKNRQTYHFDALEEPGAEPVLLMNHDTIDVGIHPYANKTVLVMGEVHSPMDIPFPLDSPLTVGIAIGRCGGTKTSAYSYGITIQRNGKTYGLSNGSKTKLAPGDVLRIPPNPYIGKSITVTGQVKTPGKVPFAADGKLDIVTALTLAGGTTQIANLKNVSVLRTVNGKPTVYTMNIKDMLDGRQQRFYLKVNDIVNVKERAF